MAAYIYSGGTPTLRFTPNNGIKVNDQSLGTPVIAVSQEGTFFSYEGSELTVDTSANTVSVTMAEEDTILLSPGVATQAQLCFYNEASGQTVRFPIHDITVLGSIIGSLVEKEGDVTYEDDGLDEDGEPYEQEEYDLVDGELEDLEDYEDYDLEEYEEDYEDTLEDDPEELFDIDDVDDVADEE